MSAAAASTSSRGRGTGFVVLVLVLAWLACAGWNFVKPMPPGTHVTSLPARLSESQVQLLTDSAQDDSILERELTVIDRAEDIVVLDQCPLTQRMAQRLLARKRQRPNLKIVLLTDPRNEAYGGTPARMLMTLEQSGIIVARTRLERLHDSNPLYSSLWRLSIGWWSDPFDEAPGQTTPLSSLRRHNLQADQRQVLVADDGAGGWSSIVSSVAPRDGASDAGLEVHGHLARDIIASELQIAAWSSDDDRLPPAPPIESRGVGTIDARFLTEGAIRSGLRDAFAAAGSGDTISIVVSALGDRLLINAMLRAAARGARLQLLLDADLRENQAVAAELVRDALGNIEVRWSIEHAERGTQMVLVRHGNDIWLDMGSADLTRRNLDDLNLEADIELHMPARAAAARAAAEAFARHWSGGAAYPTRADESPGLYWRYRFAEVTGLASF